MSNEMLKKQVKSKEINQANSVLSNETKREINDQYGSMGLQLAEQFGEENSKAYLLVNSKWCKFLIVFFFCITGCCFCLCCCCCFNWCCGKCNPNNSEANDNENIGVILQPHLLLLLHLSTTFISFSQIFLHFQITLIQ